MLKSRVFSFNEQNLLRDIAEFEKTGRHVSQLECDLATAYVWFGVHRNELNYPTEFNKDDVENGIMGRYRGVPIIINNNLNDGVIGIK